MQRSGASSGSAQAIAVNTAGAHEDDADFLAFHVEHIVAKQHGGSDDPETLCYACSECNWAKGPNLSGMLNDKLYPLFNPRKQNWTRHFYWDHTILVGKTNMPRHVWLSMPERRFIFWSEHYSPAMIQLASRENARVAVCELKPLAGVDPLHILLHVHQQAMPWIEAMDEAVCFLPPTERSLLLAGLELTPTAWCAFRDGCSRRAREILLQCPEHAHIIEAAHTEGGDVVERPDGWYARETGEQISDAIIRFQRILVPTKGPTLVQGQLRFRGEELPFLEPVKPALHSPVRWARKRLLAAGKGNLKFLPSWEQHALQMIYQFHEPVLRRDPGRIGWHDEEDAFVLPHLVIRRSGEVHNS